MVSLFLWFDTSQLNLRSLRHPEKEADIVACCGRSSFYSNKPST
ncbi:hypothetical protein [Nostoc sp. LPT]|nr:hypothetical protein [Nostoc sp. LPT]